MLATTVVLACRPCGSDRWQKNGHTQRGAQKALCLECQRTFILLTCQTRAPRKLSNHSIVKLGCPVVFAGLQVIDGKKFAQKLLAVTIFSCPRSNDFASIEASFPPDHSSVAFPSCYILRTAMPMSFKPHPGFRLLTASILALLGIVSSIDAETTSASGAIAISSLPYPITQPGTYYLVGDLSISNQNAIVITAANVNLDLNGHLLSDSSGLANASTGIYITTDHVTVHDGRVSGFTYCVTTVGNQCRIENVTVDGATYCGICSPGANTVIHRCHVTNTGGNTIWADASAYGILVYNASIRVLDCDVSVMTPRSGGASGGIVYIYGDAGMLVGNRVRSCASGIIISSTATKYRDNLCTADVTTPYTGGTDAGNNN